MSDIPGQIRAALNTNRILTVTLHARIQPVLERLTQEQDLLDGYPPTASGSDNGPPGTSTTSSTETAAIARLAGHHHQPPPTTILDEGLDLALAATQIMRLLHTWCDNHGEQLTAADLNRLRCINWRQDDGHSCGNFATPRRHNNTTIDDGRCLGCGKTADDLDDEKRKTGEDRRFRRAQNERDRYHQRDVTA